MIRVFYSCMLLFVSIACFSQKADSTILNEGIEHVLNKNYDNAKSLLLYSADSSSINKLEKGKANYFLRSVLRNEGNVKEANERAEHALAIFQQLEDHYWIGFTLYTVCMDNLIAGSYDIALIQAQKSYQAFEQAKDSTKMIQSMARRGIVFHDIEEYEEGIRVCAQAQKIFDAYSEKHADMQALIWGITAINYDDKGESGKAVELYKQILTLENQLSSNREIIRTYNNMGNSLMKLGHLDEAEKYIQLNLEANIENEFDYGIATATTNLGTIAYKKGNYRKAENLLNKAKRIAFEIGDTEKILDALQQKYLMFEQSNNATKALDYLKKYHTVKDSLYDLDKQRQIRLLETQFETERKEQQIALQRAEITEQETEIERNRLLLFGAFISIILIILIAILQRSRLKKKQLLKLQEAQLEKRDAEIKAAIATQEKERSRYARDLHDGFGQMISVLNMNLKSLQDGAKPNERQKVFEASEKVIDEMYGELKNICFDLMPQTLINHGLESALNEFVARINHVGKLYVELNVFGLEERLTELQEISLYRISQEWINNILKYSNAEKITLQITKDEGEITLLIEDNGSGFDKSILTIGKGNGWKNLNTRAKLIHGELELETNPNQKGNVLIVNAPSIFNEVQENSHQNTMKTV